MSHAPDTVTAKDAGGGFDPHSEGQHAMLCVDVVDLGTNVELFPGKQPQETAKIALVFASGERQGEKKDELTLVTSEMTNSANEKANLRKFLESWRGKSYTPEQVEAGLPLHKLHGQAGLITIEHVLTRKNKKFAKIRSVAQLPPVIPAPDKAILAEYERPKFLVDRKAQYAEALKKHRASLGAGIPEPEMPNGDDTDDDLPF